MKTLLRKMTSFLMAFFMVIQVMLPAFTITSKAEEVKPNTIKSIEEIKDDENVNISITKSQLIYDKKHIKKDQDKFSLALTMPDTTSNFRLVKRINLKLYDDGYFDSNEQASKEYWRVKDMLNDQGLDLDLEIINDEEGYRLVTKEELENIEENEKESPYGSNYTYIDFKVMDDFDFNEKGNQKLFNEDKLVFNLEFLQYESLDPNFNLYEKDKDGNLTIKNEGDIFALIRDENKTLYTTKSLKEDFENLNNLIEEENKKQEEKIQKEETEKEKSQQDQPIKKEPDKNTSISSIKEEKKQDEKSSSNKEDSSQNKKEENKESKTEVTVESNEKSIENSKSKDEKENLTDKKYSTQTTKKEENKDEKEKSSKNNQVEQKSEDKKQKKKAEENGLMPKLRMLFLGQDEPEKEKVRAAQNNESESNLENKKFTIRTRFDTSNRLGPIKAGQYFNIHLDKKLTVKDPSSLEDIIYKGNVIARPSYDSKTNTIKYELVRDIDEDINKLLNIDVDYNITNVQSGESFTIVNSISGLGVTNPKALPAEKIDKNGNPAGTIIEEGRDDVVQIIGEDDEDYKVNMDIVGNPVVEGLDMTGINWTLRVDSTVDLKDLGYKLNLTTVEGSGLGEIQNVKINGKSVDLTDQLGGKLGISDSKHHDLNENAKTLVYTFNTPVTNKQASYMIDVSTILTNKNNKVGALRHILNEGYPQEKIEENSPNRTSMNNRTTIKGEFKTEDKAEWTITDAVSTGDTNKGLPLETRTLENQSLNSGKRAVYGINTETGKMEVKTDESTISNVPAKETDPANEQAVGNIGVYKFDTKLNSPDKATDYSVGGVTISKYKDIIVDQHWSLARGYEKIPAQTITVKDSKGSELGKTTVNEETGHQRLITIPNVRFWNIGDDGQASMIDHKVDQPLPSEVVTVDGKQYKFRENANYYDVNSKTHYITNALMENNNKVPATFTVIKVDANNPEKRISGSNFYLLGAEISITTDSNGEATFNNIKPGTYTLKETKAPAGYKLDQEEKTIKISDKGEVSISGKNAQFSFGSGKTDILEHSDYPNWKDFMNTQHYGKIDENGNLKFYVYLKPYDQRVGGRTDKDTTFNISIPEVNLQDSNIKVYDVSPSQRPDIFASMNNQKVDQKLSNLGRITLGAPNNNGAIDGHANVQNPLSGNTGYQISFPQGRFGDNWGFLVEVSSNIGNKDSTVLSYDWLAKENPANQSKIRANVNLSKNSEENGHPTITISNEELPKSEIEVAKFADTSTDGKKDRLGGAEFVLKDENGEIIANKITGEDGKLSFGKYPTGTYYLEEVKAPEGYEKSNVYFRVTVSEDGQVSYDAKFKDSDSSPTAGVDYYIEREEGGQAEGTAKVTRVNQSMVINDDEGSGNFRGVWEAYRLESLKYHLDATISNAAPGSRFEIQFDPNLDFTQYFKTFPNLYFNGKMIAEPYFNYKTNLLTYVFNENSLSNGETRFSLDLKGMIPSKFYATHSGDWQFTNIVAPNQSSGTIDGNQVENITVHADYDGYDTHTTKGKFPSQAYYFRDVYKADDGNWYVKAIGYYNPLGDYKTGNANKIWFNWKFANYQGAKQETWQGQYESPYYLDDVKIYETTIPPLKRYEAHRDYNPPVNDYMPLSMGVRPEQNPDIYSLVYHAQIDHTKAYNRSQGGFNLSYDPNKVTNSGPLYDTQNPPLTISVPKINPTKDAYLIEQTFRIRDIDEFNTHWRAFYMANGDENGNRAKSLNSSFVTGPNKNYSKADQTGEQLPSFAKEVVGIINKKYQPASFKISKLNEANHNEKLQGATFVLTDSDGNKIYRTSNQNGEVNFKNLAPGRYTLKEYKAPNNFEKSNTEWDVIVYNDGNVKITSRSITGQGEEYTGKDIINIPVTNKPASQKFRVYKKDGNGNPLAGAKFKITDPKNSDKNFPLEATSDQNGVVEFTGKPQENKDYVLEEVEPPAGYKPLDKKWVIRIENGKTKIYTYSKSDGKKVKSILGEASTNWINVKERPTTGWSSYDNRLTGWTANSTDARYMGTRIIAINKEKNYVIQRYVINPEARQIANTTAIIHREKPEYPNMDWYNNEEVKVFTLDPKEGGNTSGKVTGFISDLRLADFKETDITNTVTKSVDDSRYGESRLKLDLPASNNPIVIDVKIPYKTLDGGVGTGMDWYEGGQTYWKSDFYESVSDIVESDPTIREEGSIRGSYVAEGSLDVTNEPKTYGFKIKKVREIDKTTPIQSAVFKLTGPDDSPNERYMTTGSDGMIAFDNLKPGTYTLEESQPASGYQKVDTKWTVTISADGKAFIKQNNENANNASLYIDRPTRLLADKDISKKEFIDKRSYQFAKIAKDSIDKNDGLEISEINPSDLLENAQKASSDWEKIDPTRSNPIDVRSNPAKDNAAPVLTNITEINKVDNRLRQVFVYGQSRYDGKDREIQIHSQPENFDVTKANSVIKVYQTSNYSVENPGNLTGITSKVTFKEETANGKKRLVATIPATYKGTIRVEIETKYDERFGVGLGTNYDSYKGAGLYIPHKSWLANSYTNESAINKGPVITYETVWEYDSEIPKPQTISVPEPDRYEDETWTVEGSTGKLYKEYKYELADGVRTGNKTATGNTKANPEAIADEYHYGIKKRPESRTSDPVNKTIEIPFETIVKDDPNLAQGVIEVDSEGQNGEAEYQYSVTFDRKNEADAVKPESWPDDLEIPAKQEGERIAAYNIKLIRTIKEKTDRIERHGSKADVEELVDNTATITNKQTGLALKIIKRDNNDRRLEKAEFELERYTDKNYTTKDTNFEKLFGTSDQNGNVILKDKEGNPVSLPVGFYRLTETKSPSGYKKPQAPFDIEVYEDGGQLKAKYKSAEHTSYDYIRDEKSYDSEAIKTAENGIKYKSKITYINTQSKTYIQRIYIDTRGYSGDSDKINIQINPKHKREETDNGPGKQPNIDVEGVKTAYRSTYKITGAPNDDNFADTVLNTYDLSKNDVTMLNTARWRPFDWGFDEDIMNLDKGGVYYIDVEGFYDDAILTGKDAHQGGKETITNPDDLEKLELNFDFYDGAREFQQAVGRDNRGNIIFKKVDKGSYQAGNLALGLTKFEKSPTGQLGKTGGRIYPPLTKDKRTRVSTSIDLHTLYSSKNYTEVPQDGMSVINEEERYNVTFSKHGRDNPNDKVDSENVTTNRLEGAIFKLQKEIANTYVDVEGSYVGSAFNGYFGFRNLEPGRYRLMEVKAPEGYKPITDPLLYFTIKTVNTNSGDVVDPETGDTVDIKTVNVRFESKGKTYNLSDLQMVDPKDSTKKLNIKDVDSKDINIETSKIVNPDTGEEVLLKDMIVVGEEQFDEKENSYYNEYPVKQIKIIPASSGYISLEYDNANGVYQYVPENKTSAKDGKLIDFVTSATAKNMGKIINEKPGEGEMTVRKVDQNGDAIKASNLLAGAEFKLTNLTNGAITTKTVGENGTILFDKLPIGNYRLEEIKSPDGYVNTNQVWNFTVGGEGLDPYAGPIARDGRNLSDKIKLTTTDMFVLNPEDKTRKKINEIHPHYGESMEFTNKFTVDKNIKINPGDFFVLNLSDVTDLNGIAESEVENLDIIAAGIGTIAKADYDRAKRTITYTFTDYAKTYSLVNFSNKLTSFIDLYKVKQTDGTFSKQKVGFYIGNDQSQLRDMKVIYDLDYGHEEDAYGNRINLVSKIVKYNSVTGEFLHYYYVNRLKEYSDGPMELRYESDQNIENFNMSVSYLYDNSNVAEDMPESFAVNENSSNLSPFDTVRSFQRLEKGYYTSVKFNKGIYNTHSYIIKVTGRVAEKDKSEYTAHGTLLKFNTNYSPTYAERHDSVHYFVNEKSGSVKPEIVAVNPENKILFRKVDQEGKALANAKFRLKYRQKAVDEWSYVKDENNNDLIKTSGEDGKFNFTKLKPGFYELEEIAAPDGYKILADPAYEFVVNSNGKIITKTIGDKPDEEKDTQEEGLVPIYIVNKKKQNISFKKVDASTKKPLKNAKFEVYYKKNKSDEYSNELLKLYEKTTDGKVERLVLKSDEKAPIGFSEVKSFTSGDEGLVDFTFYESGYYALKEIKAPSGYITPKDYVKEFAAIDGKIQEEKYKTEMSVKKTQTWSYPKQMYKTDISMKINPDNENITYIKDKSKLILSELPYANEITKTKLSIKAYLVDSKGNKTNEKSYNLTDKDYTDNKGSKEIDLYNLVKELEGKTTDDPISSNKTIVLEMSSVLKQDTQLSIKSNMVIDDKTKEDRTFDIGTITDEHKDHSFNFDNMEDINSSGAINIENKKLTLPLTNGIRPWIGFTILGLILMILGVWYYNKRKNKELEISSK